MCTDTVVRKPAKQVDSSGNDVELDENVKAKLPHGCEIVSVTPSGTSLWVQTVRIETRLADGTFKAFFKKGASGDRGYQMMEGTFAAESALYSAIPEHVPRPLAWGTYKSLSDIHFYLCDFVDMLDDVPSAREWAETVASLHLNSMGKSPNGKFGFHVTTHLANVPVDNTWNQSWEVFWTQQMRSLLEQEEILRGPNEEFSILKSALYSKVIPRLLRSLEMGNRSIRPCLIHSDLWPGNIKPKLHSDELCMFDGCAYWGHNEADLGVCRNPRYRLGKPFLKEYFKRIPMSEPEEDFDDRNALYALKFHVLISIMYPTEPRYRVIAMDEMRRLVGKFPNGIEEYELANAKGTG